MAKVQFFKVASLPASLEADCFYFIENGTYAESYVTDDAGVAKLIGNTTMITDITNTLLAGFSTLEIVADILARDALSLSTNSFVLVLDASADATVSSGAALYVWDNANSQFIKVAEYESLDLVIDWTDIQNGPSSTPAQIDQAVSDSHAHPNKPILDLLDEDANQTLTFRGEPVLKWTTVNW